MVSVMRRQVGFAAAISHARMRLSRLGRIGRTCGPHRRESEWVGAVVAPPFLSYFGLYLFFLSAPDRRSRCMWEYSGSTMLGGLSVGVEVARAAWMGPGLFVWLSWQVSGAGRLRCGPCVAPAG